jgi:urea carboxylase
VWNPYKQTVDFNQPWLLRFFDQIRFFPVSAEELLRYREEVIQGKVKLEIEPATFNLREYHEFLRSNSAQIEAFRARQRAAFAAERDRWAAAGEFTRQESLEDAQTDAAEPDQIILPDNVEGVVAHVSANVWQVLVQVGDRVQEGDRLVILEAMKMEIAVVADASGTVTEIFCQPGQTLTAGQLLLAIDMNLQLAV